jgi:hypothetical protein
MSIDIFIRNIEYGNYFENQLILSSTLLGLLIATSTFLLQSGFSSFEYSRTMFLKYYVRLTKFLFLLLAYNIIISIVFLYLERSSSIAFLIHSLFSLIFIKYFLDFYSHKGYIHTLFSAKFNPRKSRIRKYLRYITNLGFVQILVIIILLSIVIIYPFWLGNFGFFTERQGFISTVISFVFCVVSLIRILPQFFNFSEQEYKQKQNNELSKEIQVDIAQELSILKETLLKNGRKELEGIIPTENIKGEIQVHLSDKKDEAFFVINVWLRSSNVEQIVRWIEKYSYVFFKELNDTNVDINSFVLSYILRIDGMDESKMYFIRAKRTELEESFRKTNTPTEFVNTIKNKLIDELFRCV